MSDKPTAAERRERAFAETRKDLIAAGRALLSELGSLTLRGPLHVANHQKSWDRNRIIGLTSGYGEETALAPTFTKRGQLVIETVVGASPKRHVTIGDDAVAKVGAGVHVRGRDMVMELAGGQEIVWCESKKRRLGGKFLIELVLRFSIPAKERARLFGAKATKAETIRMANEALEGAMDHDRIARVGDFRKLTSPFHAFLGAMASANIYRSYSSPRGGTFFCGLREDEVAERLRRARWKRGSGRGGCVTYKKGKSAVLLRPVGGGAGFTILYPAEGSQNKKRLEELTASLPSLARFKKLDRQQQEWALAGVFPLANRLRLYELDEVKSLRRLRQLLVHRNRQIQGALARDDSKAVASTAQTWSRRHLNEYRAESIFGDAVVADQSVRLNMPREMVCEAFLEVADHHMGSLFGPWSVARLDGRGDVSHLSLAEPMDEQRFLAGLSKRLRKKGKGDQPAFDPSLLAVGSHLRGPKGSVHKVGKGRGKAKREWIELA